jgi:hypothetical protein
MLLRMAKVFVFIMPYTGIYNVIHDNFAEDLNIQNVHRDFLPVSKAALGLLKHFHKRRMSVGWREINYT